MTSNELKQAKQALQKLKAKIDLVDTNNLVKQKASVQEKFSYCEKQYFILSGKLENAELKKIADKIVGLETEFKNGIKNLENTIQRVNDGIAFLGVLDNVVSIVARIATILV